MKPLLRSLAVAALLVPALPHAQTTLPASVQVSQLAPQLIAFAGGQTNFDNLANGLAAGAPVTLVTTLLNGQVQTVSFTPQGTMTPAQIAQTLVAAQQSLIGQGIAIPTGQQVAVALTGGVLPTQVGAVQVAGVLPAANRPATAAAGGTAPPGTPTTPAATSVPARGVVTPTVPVASTTNTPVTVTTTPVPAVNPNGAPSPAAQLQGQTEAGGPTPPGPAQILQNQRTGNVSDTPTIGNISNNPSTGATQLGTTSPTTPVAPAGSTPAPASPAATAPSSGRGLR